MSAKMQEFTVFALTNPPMLVVALLGMKPEIVARVVKGHSLEDAKRRAGIQ